MDRVERRVGQVTAIRPGQVTVRITQLSACAGCHARGVCASTDCAERYVTASTDDAKQFKIGDEVVIQGERHIGRLAVLLSFVLPLILLFISLIFSIKVLVWEEGVSILLSMVVLALYYGVLYLLEPHLKLILRLRVQRVGE